jgi:hypothetical protein
VALAQRAVAFRAAYAHGRCNFKPYAQNVDRDKTRLGSTAQQGDEHDRTVFGSGFHDSRDWRRFGSRFSGPKKKNEDRTTFQTKHHSHFSPEQAGEYRRETGEAQGRIDKPLDHALIGGLLGPKVGNSTKRLARAWRAVSLRRPNSVARIC